MFFFYSQMYTLSSFKVTKHAPKAHYIWWKSTCCCSLCMKRFCDVSLFIVCHSTKTNNDLTTPVWQLDSRCWVIQTWAFCHPETKSQITVSSGLNSSTQNALCELNSLIVLLYKIACKSGQFDNYGKISGCQNNGSVYLRAIRVCFSDVMSNQVT